MVIRAVPAGATNAVPAKATAPNQIQSASTAVVKGTLAPSAGRRRQCAASARDLICRYFAQIALPIGADGTSSRLALGIWSTATGSPTLWQWLLALMLTLLPHHRPRLPPRRRRRRRPRKLSSRRHRHRQRRPLKLTHQLRRRHQVRQIPRPPRTPTLQPSAASGTVCAARRRLQAAP